MLQNLQMRRRLVRALLLPGLLLSITATGCSDDSTPAACFEGPLTLDRELLAKAEPDECFVAVGVPYPDGPFCPEGSQPKVNGGYVFGLTESGEHLWFGTSANQICTVLGSVFEFLDDMAPDLTLDTQAFVCEFGQSHYRDVFVPPPSSDLDELPPSLGDWRPPQIYSHDLESKELVERTPDDPLVQDTLGFRSAGSLDDLVILGGPDLQAGFVAEGGSINLFAFDGVSGEYLGSRAVPEYLDIRKWLAVDGVLYTAVKTRDGGRVLRWTGTVDDPFQWVEVGVLDAEGAELAEHDGRLFVTTWWNQLGGQLAGLWMSPKLRPGGLDASDAGSWEKVWSVADYEPDDAIAYSYFGGALHSFEGDLYWGTINFPLVSLGAHVLLRGLDVTQDLPEILLAIAPSYRGISIHRGRNFDEPGKKHVEVLYGEAKLFAYENDRWSPKPNRTGAPVYGHSGFANPFNAYTWTMGVYDEQLYVGTFDWSFIAGQLVRTLAEAIGVPEADVLDRLPPLVTAGADLWRFPDERSPAIPASLDGVGNHANYGIRTMLSRPEALYLGTANPMNLLTDPDDALPEGGWELLALRRRHGGCFPVLAPSLKSPQPVGTTVHWVAHYPTLSEYRFKVRGPSGVERIVRDFDTSPTFAWTPLEEGFYQVTVSVRDESGREGSHTALFKIDSRVTTSAVVSRTRHPLVALYSAPPCASGDRLRVHLRAAGDAVWKTEETPWIACVDGKSVNLYVAGLRPETDYELRHELESGEVSGALPFRTGLSRIDAPQFDVVLPPQPGSSLEDDVILHSLLFGGEGLLPLACPVATDLDGQLIWYYEEPCNLAYLASLMNSFPTPTGGTFLMHMSRPALPFPVRGNILREIDLAGNPVRETHVDRINEQLVAMGRRPIYYFHHDTRRLEDGHTLVMGGVERLVADLQGPGLTDVVGDMVIDLDEDWQVVWAWDATDDHPLLPLDRRAKRDEDCGDPGPLNVCGPLRLAERAERSHDWSHGNTVTYTPHDGNLIVSFRHQDWVIKIDYADGAGTGEILWRLGPEGDFAIAQAISPPDPFPWFSGQHQPLLYGMDELVVYDNSNLRDEANPGTVNSRGQVYVLDEAGRVATLVTNADLGVYASFLGSAQKLSNGNYHFLSGGIAGDEPGLIPGFPSGSSQSTEADPDGNLLYTLDAPSHNTYRSFRMRNLYEVAGD